MTTPDRADRDRRFPPEPDPASLQDPIYRKGPHFLLMSPRSPANCGAAARALKNCGMRSLSLIALEEYAWKDYLGDHARATAWRAYDVLLAARRPASLAEAKRDLTALIAVDPDPPEGVVRLSLTEAADLALSDPDGTGFLFGRENDGLTRQELHGCTHGLAIPTAPDYGDLNLAQSLLLVAWEIHRRRASAAPPKPDGERLATHGEIDRLVKRTEAWLRDTHFISGDNLRSARGLLKMLLRARPKAYEISLLLGVIHQARWRARRGGKTAEK